MWLFARKKVLVKIGCVYLERAIPVQTNRKSEKTTQRIFFIIKGSARLRAKVLRLLEAAICRRRFIIS